MALLPPVGRDVSHASRSSGRYRTNEPTLRNAGPRLSRRHLRNDATLMLSRFDTSCSVIRLTMISSWVLSAPQFVREWQRHFGTHFVAPEAATALAFHRWEKNHRKWSKPVETSLARLLFDIFQRFSTTRLPCSTLFDTIRHISTIGRPTHSCSGT